MATKPIKFLELHYTMTQFLIKAIIIKFPYNTRFDWLKERTLPENKEQVNGIKLAFKFLLHLSAHWGDLIEQINKKSVIYTLTLTEPSSTHVHKVNAGG